MKCQDCIHWVAPRSVDSLPDYPIGFCEIFQKDVGGEFAGCAGRFFLSRDEDEWEGRIEEKEVPVDASIEIPEGAKIISISEESKNRGMLKVTYLVPEDGGGD